ncbi:MAG: hypothetical protein MUP64_09740, partial [Anaerolineae bacterium]|nr:hypothetical protein [Anaerolineae bacterium]
PIEKKHVTTEEQAAKSYLAFDALSPLLDPCGELLIACIWRRRSGGPDTGQASGDHEGIGRYHRSGP